MEHLSFLNPEATKAVCEYLEWRNRNPTYKNKDNKNVNYRGKPANILKSKREWRNHSD
ncbi:hypothetical protein SAMN06264941_1918 [Methanohalophilus portucalensis FDF-1]|uniref:Uncharacterized protein n=1 Tax=Methanohalophilus portucalensis FDF-1 TaxID=523843 RepID=A0A1X7NXP5_9EURY|nr:hypothetical protein SAMN06264941_1918 [Methanohalophilus portucalensis FDF-1]